MWKLGRKIVDFLLPRRCFGCGVHLTAPTGYRYLCDKCLREIDWIHSHFCPRCSAQDIEFPDSKGCEFCIERNFAFRRNRSIYGYMGIGRKLIHELKYRQGHYLLPDFGRMSRELAFDFTDALVVPVPLHWRRQWSRGFNQSELLCRQLIHHNGGKLCRLLRRLRSTPRQVGLNFCERQENVKNAFIVDGRVLRKKNIALDQKIILVDDVFTTGATLHACASALAKNGFTHIETVTFARA
jgi:ComF family protein